MVKRHGVVGAVLAALMVAFGAGCGGAADETSALDVDASTLAARAGGKTTTSPASLVIAPNPATLGGAMTISLYPAAYASERLFITWACFQNGVAVAHDGSDELHAAVSQNFPGYAGSGDHIDWTFVLEPTSTFSSGPANCNVEGWYSNRKSQWIRIAAGTFDVQ